MRIFFFLLLTLHSLIHLLGFVKAFNLAEVSQLTQGISKPAGAAWLLAAILLLVGAVLFLLKIEYWWLAAAPGVILSQVLIIISWTDAKFGTIANVLILLPLTISILNSLPSSFANLYKAEVRKGLASTAGMPIVREEEIAHLPTPVQKYLRYAGVIGKPHVRNMRVRCTGQIRPKMDGGWLDFESQQYNFFDNPARLFFIESSMYGLPFDGLHAYVGPAAIMQIKVAAMLLVVDAKGPEMNQGETVTMFNDMCVMAPATLINKIIQWESIDSLTAKATFTNEGNTISAVLYFNESGELVNFTSDDRYQSEDGKVYKNYRWSTPMKNYKDFGGIKIATFGEASWQTPNGEFVYGRFNLLDVEYNCGTLK
ncbi:MAG: hypothetical protein HW389_3281 [Bacteroidetes bacterium]|nr:hypothetical protein [Bacteroidota bacterium]